MSIFYFGVVRDFYDLKNTKPMCYTDLTYDEETDGVTLIPSDVMVMTTKVHELYKMIEMVDQASGGTDILSIDSFQENTWLEPFLALREDEHSKSQGKFCLSFQIYRLDARDITMMPATKVACTRISGGVTFFDPSEGSPLTAMQMADVISLRDGKENTQ